MFCSFHSTSVSCPWLIPKYFIVCDATVNGIVFVISLSGFSLFTYGNAMESCVLPLYSATSLKSFIGSNSFLVKSLEFST